MRKAARTAWALAAVLGAGIFESWAQEREGASGRESEQLGEVNFSVSCNEAAQREFNRAMALFHSFWFDPAIKSFQKVLEQDPACGMAYWGIALMSMGNPFSWPPNEKPMRLAATAMAQAERVGAKTERERNYIAAIGVFLRDWETAEYRPRAVAFEEAMAGVAARYPQDDEAQILYALVLDVTALPTDKTYANQRKAADILEPLFKKYPDHPGVAHYLIHTYDYAGLAKKGLPAARAYARIAPSAPLKRDPNRFRALTAPPVPRKLQAPGKLPVNTMKDCRRCPSIAIRSGPNWRTPKHFWRCDEPAEVMSSSAK